jgi:hypothetical protein
MAAEPPRARTRRRRWRDRDPWPRGGVGPDPAARRWSSPTAGRRGERVLVDERPSGDVDHVRTWPQRIERVGVEQVPRRVGRGGGHHDVVARARASVSDPATSTPSTAAGVDVRRTATTSIPKSIRRRSSASCNPRPPHDRLSKARAAGPAPRSRGCVDESEKVPMTAPRTGVTVAGCPTRRRLRPSAASAVRDRVHPRLHEKTNDSTGPSTSSPHRC